MDGVFRLLIFLGIAFVPSVLGALSGIGGGLIIKPVLDAVSSFSAGGINFLSGCTVLAMSGVSLTRSRMRGIKLEDRRGTILAAGTVFGGIGGKLIFSAVVSGVSGGSLTGLVQSAILIILTLVVLVYMARKEKTKGKNIQSRPFCFILGLILGMLSSFLGIGGGPINIMVISYFLDMDSKTAGLYSIYTIFLSQLAGLTITLVSGKIPAVPLAVPAFMIAGGITGGLLGSGILRSLDNTQVDVLFRYIMAVVILLSGYNLVKFALAF